MTPAFLEASLSRDRALAERAIAATLPEPWLDANDHWLHRRLEQLRADPSLQPWLTRALVLTGESQVIGHVGFHARPGEAYLEELAPGGVELGYTVHEAWRQRGYAIEAVTGLIEWAHAHHGVTRFVVSISPENLASLALARRLGFVRIGSHVDERDGPEDIFERRFAP